MFRRIVENMARRSTGANCCSALAKKEATASEADFSQLRRWYHTR